jgi:hypothetical protein
MPFMDDHYSKDFSLFQKSKEKKDEENYQKDSFKTSPHP